jgi:hypothetical protein
MVTVPDFQDFMLYAKWCIAWFLIQGGAVTRGNYSAGSECWGVTSPLPWRWCRHSGSAWKLTGPTTPLTLYRTSYTSTPILLNLTWPVGIPVLSYSEQRDCGCIPTCSFNVFVYTWELESVFGTIFLFYFILWVTLYLNYDITDASV